MPAPNAPADVDKTPAGRERARKKKWFVSWVVFGALATNALVTGMFASTAGKTREQFEQSSKIVGLNLVQSLEKGLEAKAASIRAPQDIIAKSVETQLAETGKLDPAKVNELLRNANSQAESKPELAIRIYDEQGDRLFGYEPTGIRTQIADRDYFQEAKAHPESKLVVGKLAIGKQIREPAMVFAVPYRRPDGSFAGVVTTRLTAKDFNALVADLRPSEGDAFVIRDSRDYGLLARLPAMPDKPGGQLGSRAIPKAVSKSIEAGINTGAEIVTDTTDGEKRTSCFSKLNKYPLIIIVAVGHKGHFAPWAKQTQSFLVFCVCFLFASALVSWALILFGIRALSAGEDACGLNQSLEEEISARGAALEAARISERSAQRELAEAERLASLGAMVAGVAHELNTPLGNSLLSSTTLSAQAKEIGDSLSTREPIKKSALRAKLGKLSELAILQAQAIERAADLVKSFKQVAVDQTSGKRRSFDLRETLESVTASLRPTLARSETDIEVSLDIPEGIECDTYPGALIQISTNMVQNAWRHAFEGRPKGSFRISAICEAGTGLVRISFSDDGVGMSSEAWARAFEPYFTTKAREGGSGVGLSLSRQLAETVLLGKLTARPGASGGVVFELSFPRERAQDGPERKMRDFDV